MMRAQVIPGLVSHLLDEGVERDTIERAVARVLLVGLGQEVVIGDGPDREFAFEMGSRLAGTLLGPSPRRAA